MSKFHQLKVRDVVQETSDSISIGFDIPAELKEEFTFIHGQYLTLKLMVNGEDVRRSYSICSSPVETDKLRIAVKKVEGGRASTVLQNVKAEEFLEVMPPMGNFNTKLDASHAKQYVAFVAGSGITPVISILKTVLHKEPQSRFILFYGNKNTPSIIFKIELEHIKSKYGDRCEVHHILTQEATGNPLFEGRMSKEKIRALISEHVNQSMPTEYFLCGPEEIIFNAQDCLNELAIPKESVHIELFASPVEGELKKKVPTVGGSHQCEVTVIMDGDKTVMSLASDGNVILDAALDAGVDVPFSCKGAVCCTCKAKVLEGTVEMEMNYALTDGEVEEGFILTCQSHPTSANVVVDYDV